MALSIFLVEYLPSKLHVFFIETGVKDSSPCYSPMVILQLQMPVDRLAWLEEMGTHSTLWSVTRESNPMLKGISLSLLSRTVLGFHVAHLCASLFSVPLIECLTRSSLEEKGFIFWLNAPKGHNTTRWERHDSGIRKLAHHNVSTLRKQRENWKLTEL